MILSSPPPQFGQCVDRRHVHLALGQHLLGRAPATGHAECERAVTLGQQVERHTVLDDDHARFGP